MKKIILVLGLCFISNICFALNRGDIETQIRQFLNDTSTDTTKQTFKDTVLDSRINIAQLDIIARTRCYEGITYINVVTGTQLYVLPSDYLIIKRAGFSVEGSSQRFKLLEAYDLYSLDSFSDVWDSSTTATPTKYYVINSSIALVSVPNVTGTSFLKINYVKRPSDLSNDTDIPFNNEFYLYPYHIIIAYYVAYMCELDRNRLERANYFEMKYFNALNIMVQELRAKPDFIQQYGASK